MARPNDDERQALIDGVRRAVARTKAICARAEIAFTARLRNDLESASRDVETVPFWRPQL